MKIHPGLSSSVTILALCAPSVAQVPYRIPAPDVVAVVDAEPEPRVQFSPDGRWMLLVERDALPSIADLSRRMLRLAGTRVDPAADGGFQTGTPRVSCCVPWTVRTRCACPCPRGRAWGA